MNHWDILGIARTTDLKIIRKAYAKTLKTIDQDAEPDRFIALRSAFETARHEAESIDLDKDTENEQLEEANPVTSNNHFSDNQPISSGFAETGFTTNQPVSLAAEIPLYQRGVEFLLDAITQQRSDVDLRYELNDYINYLLNLGPDVLSPEQIQLYLQQLHDACVAANLDGIDDFLTSNSHTTAFEHEVDLNQSSTHQSAIRAEEHFKQQLDDLCEQLWHENFSDAVFDQFSDVLQQLQQQTLDDQMSAYDQLSYVLGSANSTEPKTNRFFGLWYDYFDNETPLASADTALHHLYERIQSFLAVEAFWRQIPEQYVKPLEAVQNNKGFQPFLVLKLVLSVNSTIQAIRQNNWSGIPDIVEPEHNSNLYFLRLWTLWLRHFLIQLSLSLLCVFIAASVFALSFKITFGIFLPLSLLYFPLILSVGLAKLFASNQRNLIISRLTTLFYLAIVILALISQLMNPTLLGILLGAWCILASFVLGFCLYFYHNIFDYLKEVINIQADKIFVYLGFGFIALVFGVIIFKVQGNNPFGVLFALFPLSLLLCGDFFKEFFKQFFKNPGQFILNLLMAFKPLSTAIGIMLGYSILALPKANHQ